MPGSEGMMSLHCSALQQIGAYKKGNPHDYQCCGTIGISRARSGMATRFERLSASKVEEKPAVRSCPAQPYWAGEAKQRRNRPIGQDERYREAEGRAVAVSTGCGTRHCLKRAARPNEDDKDLRRH